MVGWWLPWVACCCSPRCCCWIESPIALLTMAAIAATPRCCCRCSRRPLRLPRTTTTAGSGPHVALLPAAVAARCCCHGITCKQQTDRPATQGVQRCKLALGQTWACTVVVYLPQDTQACPVMLGVSCATLALKTLPQEPTGHPSEAPVVYSGVYQPDSCTTHICTSHRYKVSDCCFSRSSPGNYS